MGLADLPSICRTKANWHMCLQTPCALPPVCQASPCEKGLNPGGEASGWCPSDARHDASSAPTGSRRCRLHCFPAMGVVSRVILCGLVLLIDAGGVYREWASLLGVGKEMCRFVGQSAGLIVHKCNVLPPRRPFMCWRQASRAVIPMRVKCACMRARACVRGVR